MRNRNARIVSTPKRTDGPWWSRRGVVLFGLAVVLVGCGETEVSQAPPPTLAVEMAAAGSLEAASPAPASDAGAGRISTFGDLADRINTAWGDVRSYRTVFTAALPGTAPAASASSQLASPVAAPPVAGNGRATPVGGTVTAGATPLTSSPIEAVRLVVLPDRQQQMLTGTGHDDHEAIVIGDTLYLRGPLAGEVVPGAEGDAWLSLPLSDLAPESAAGHVLAGLSVPPTSPLASLREGLRPQQLRDLGGMQVGERVCHAFGGADTTAIGTRQDITIAIDDAGLPCLIETHVGTRLVSRVVYDDFNAAFSIDPPGDATPVSGLLPPATPLARD